MIETNVAKVGDEVKTLKMYFGILKESFDKFTNTASDQITVSLSKDKIKRCIKEIGAILGDE